MLDFTIATVVGIIGFSINSYQSLVVDKLKSDPQVLQEKCRKKGSEHIHRAFWKRKLEKRNYRLTRVISSSNSSPVVMIFVAAE